MKEWRSQITQVRNGLLETRGNDQQDLIQHSPFEDVIFLLLRGTLPTPTERDLLRAVLVSHMSHGITGQSTLAVRMAADCRSSFLHALIAGYSTGAGRYHQGGLEATMTSFTELAALRDEELEGALERRLAGGERLIGFGHRFHKEGDPRARTLIALARKHEFAGKHITLLARLSEFLARRKNIHMNIEAACAAILLDLGFCSEVGHLFIVLGRSTMFAAAYKERLDQAVRPFPILRVYDE